MTYLTLMQFSLLAYHLNLCGISLDVFNIYFNVLIFGMCFLNFFCLIYIFFFFRNQDKKKDSTHIFLLFTTFLAQEYSNSFSFSLNFIPLWKGVYIFIVYDFRVVGLNSY